MPIRSSEASSDGLLFLGMWLRMWSSMSSAMRLLMAPLAAASPLKDVCALFIIIERAQNGLQLPDDLLCSGPPWSVRRR
jgi:hypothetical protein